MLPSTKIIQTLNKMATTAENRKLFQGVQLSTLYFLVSGKGIGDVAVLKREKEKRFIYYLITKEKYSHKPTYKSLADSLTSMKEHMLRNGVMKLSMPRIGCGLDLLEWGKVEEMLRDMFSDMDLQITVYTLGAKK